MELDEATSARGGAVTQKAFSVRCRFSRTCCACFACFLASLSLFFDGAYGQSQAAVVALHCRLQRMVGHQARHGELHFPHPLVSGYPCRTATSAQSPLANPNKGGQNQKSKRPLGVTMMPLGATSISKYGSLVRPDAQIVALRAHCTRTALKAPPYSHQNHENPIPTGKKDCARIQPRK